MSGEKNSWKFKGNEYSFFAVEIERMQEMADVHEMAMIVRDSNFEECELGAVLSGDNSHHST